MPGPGGEWQPAQHDHGGHEFYTQLRQFLGSLPPSERELIRAELREKLKLGSRGELVFGPGREHDVDLIASSRFVLELRLSSVGAADPGDAEQEPAHRHVRLYYVEPAKDSELLLLLLIKSKPPGKIGLQEQNAHAREAAKIADEHCRQNGLL